MDNNPYKSTMTAASSAAARPDDETARRIERQQAYVDRLLRYGIIYSIVWMAGFGSMYSLYLANKAHRTIRNSHGTVRGMVSVWWCYLMGGSGVLIFATIALSIYNNR